MTTAISGLRKFALAYVDRRYSILFYILILTLLATPVLGALKFSGAFIESLLAACLLAAILPVNAVRRRRSLLVALVAVWLTRPLTVWLHHQVLSAITLLIWTLVGLLAAAAALRYAMRATKVDSEHLYAALNAYLLAGIYFGLLYWFLGDISPTAFTATSAFSRTSAIYFSFVTLATLGYGDIAPRSEIARGLAIVEGVGGQLFLAVLVARLVSLYSTQEKQST